MMKKSSNIPILVAVCSAALTTGGTTYAFGLYGETLKEKLHLTQGQLDTLSTANFCAGLLGWAPGLLVDWIGGKWGLVTGGTSGAVSLILYWAVANQVLFYPQINAESNNNNTQFIVIVLSLLGILTFLSCSLITGSIFKLVVLHCDPGAKGKAVGAAKGYVGLGAGLYAVLFEALARENNLDFLILGAVCFVLAAVVPSLLLLPSSTITTKNNSSQVATMKTVDLSTPMHFVSLYVGLLVMAVLVVGDSLLKLFTKNNNLEQNQEETKHSENKPDYLMVVFVVLVWMAPIWSMLFLPTAPRLDDKDEYEYDPEIIETATKPEAETLIKKGNNDQNGLDDEDSLLNNAATPSFNLPQMLQTIPAWLFFVASIILVGSGTMVTNNIGQMVKSLRFSNTVTPPALALFSVAQSFGRVVTGAVSEYVVQIYNKPRSIFVALASVIAMTSHLILAVAASRGAFIAGIALAGLAFGMIWPLMVLIVGELFGTKHHGGNYMFFDGLASAAGTLIMSKVIAQTVYDKHGDGTQCDGMACFSATHWAIVAFSILSLSLSLCMPYTKLSRQVYKAQ